MGARVKTEYTRPSLYMQKDHKEELELRVTIWREPQLHKSCDLWSCGSSCLLPQTAAAVPKRTQIYSTNAKRHGEKMGVVRFLCKPSDFCTPCKGPLCKELTTCWSHPLYS